MQDQHRHVVVGVDGSDHAKRALAWAMAKTDVLGPVTPVLAYSMQPLGDGLGMPGMYVEIDRIVKEDAEERLKASIAEFPELTGRARVVCRSAGPALVGASVDADLLVVGSRGRSAAAETLFGSIGSYCVKHASVPVAVITEETAIEPAIERAVVGVDGSPNSVEALTWALRHVDPGGRIVAVGCWTDHIFGEPPLPNPELEAATADVVDRAVEEALAAIGAATIAATEARPVIETHISQGDPRIVLRDLAATADLLVIGARGHRGVSYLLLGSTTSSLLHHPLSPTVVVPFVE